MRGESDVMFTRGPNTATGKSRTAAALEETKMNFYQLKNYEGDLPYNIEKEEDEAILEGKIDPMEWRREMERVY
jgi:hypothetical protein